MDETGLDLDELQQLLDTSYERSGEHLRSAFGQGGRASAAQVVDALHGIFELHLAVVTSEGAPLVAPIDGILHRGRVWIGIPRRAVRARLIRRDPRVSASYVSPELSFILHGRFHEPAPDAPELAAFSALARSLYVAQYGDWFGGWLDERERTEGPGVTGYLEPRGLFAKGAA